MKALILPAAILINLISYTARADDPVGRFQLVPATIESTETGTPTQDRMLFKIDTVTGRTWYYFSTLGIGSKKGTFVEIWMEIEDYIELRKCQTRETLAVFALLT